MEIRAICGCGGENYVKSDWFSHWKHGKVLIVGEEEFVINWHKPYPIWFCTHPKLRAIYFFFTTKIIINWK